MIRKGVWCSFTGIVLENGQNVASLSILPIESEPQGKLFSALHFSFLFRKNAFWEAFGSQWS